MKKALVAMSGGVDSAVAALLLKRGGYDLTGITMRLWNDGEDIPDAFYCPPDENAIEAKKIAELLGFEHLTTALGHSFKKEVVDRFVSDYALGKTPNPCVECNRALKFGALFDIAAKLDIPYLATGHYAKIVQDESGRFLLKKGADSAKDQSYFLWSIKKEHLPFILFPLGDFSKPQIRELAQKNGFNNASRSDSQDICFVPDGEYVSFIEKYCGRNDSFKCGNFVSPDGEILGKHQGLVRYTVGQRKGLGIAVGRPIFVGGKDPITNTVLLCSDRELYKTELYASKINILTDESFDTPVKLEAKIRYRHTPALACIERCADGRLHVVFDEPQRAIAPGQSVVFYDGDTVVGGGIID